MKTLSFVAAVLAVFSLPAHAGSWGDGDNLTVPVVCLDQPPLDTVLKMAEQSLESAAGALGLYVETGLCFVAPPGRGFPVALIEFIDSGFDVDGDEHEIWKVAQDEKTGFVLILATTGPHISYGI